MGGEKLLLQFIGVDMVTKIVENIGHKVDTFMTKIENSQKGMASNLMKGGVAAMAAGSLLTATAAGEGVAMLKLAENVATAGHAQHDLAEQFGMSAHAAGVWGVVADTVGVDTGQLAVGFKTLAKNMESLKLLNEAGDAKFMTAQTKLLADQTLKLNELKRIGNKHLVEEQQKLIANTQAKLKNLEAAHAQTEALRPLQAVFDTLGVKIHDASGELLPMNDVMLQVADAFQKMPDGAEKSALAIKLFGRSGVDLISMLNEGSDGIKKFMQQAELSGKVLSDSETEEAEKAFRANQQLKQAIAGVTTQLALAFLPVLEKLIKAITPWLHGLADWIQHHQKLLGVLVPIVIVGTALLGMLLMLGGAIATIAGIFMAWTVIAAVVGPIMVGIGAAALPLIIIIAALALAALAIWFAITHWDQIKEIAGKVWQAIGDMVGKIGVFFGQMIANVVGIWTEFWKHPLYYVGLAVGFVIGSVIRIHDEVVKWLSQMILNAALWLAKLPENAQKAFTDFIIKLGTWALTAGPQFKKAGEDFVKQLWDQLKQLPGKALTLGIDIAKGVLKGLTSIPGAVKDGAGQFIGGILDGAKKAAGIKSPSALFRQAVGLPIALGIAEGIKAGIPGAMTALDALVGAALPTGHPKARHAAVKGTAQASGGASVSTLAGNKVEELLQQIVDLLKDGALSGGGGGNGQGALSPYQILASFNHLVEAAQMQRNRGTRAGWVS